MLHALCISESSLGGMSRYTTLLSTLDLLRSESAAGPSEDWTPANERACAGQVVAVGQTNYRVVK